ncbi:MAG: hypothetical protein SAJ12_02565 [Jaaginema sp. PMC 1079.18]|nr:hypothetical protein [Jaaginema sp. PMC 1080.18]MEC4849872.1 hypothetical protein [Jaaginema sp. PMC 1079.18]MEC4866861.1 hypothetical protein [Jaaginema sp. PMC 1078.18]
MFFQPELLKQSFGLTQVYYPQLARVAGSVTAAILLVYLIDQKTEDWQQYKETEIEKTTGLTLAEQVQARDRLQQKALIQLRLTHQSQMELRLNLTELQQKLEIFERLIFSQSNPHLPPPIPKPNIPPVPQPNIPSVSPSRDPYFGQPRQPLAVPVTPHYQFQGPWTSREQFEGFQRALLAYFAAQGKPNPSGYMFKVIDGMSKGMISPYWDDFEKGLPLGTSEKVQQDWEIAPGIPYPAFAEERTQYYIHKGEPLEAAVARARADLRNAVLAKDLWEGFLRKCDRLAKEAQQNQQRGVQTPYLPPAFTARSQPTKNAIARQINAVNTDPTALPSPSETPAKPSLETLQNLCRNSLGLKIVAQQLAEHPEWGYRLEGQQVVAEINEPDELA